MAEQAEALIGNDFRFMVGQGASPETYEDMCATLDFGDLGEEKTLLDITTLCSTAREYRNGLADGKEIPLKVNFKDGDTQLRDLYEDFGSNEIRNFRIEIVGGASPHETFDFAATVRGWSLNAPVGDKASMTFQLKISGPIVWDYT